MGNVGKPTSGLIGQTEAKRRFNSSNWAIPAGILVGGLVFVFVPLVVSGGHDVRVEARDGATFYDVGPNAVVIHRAFLSSAMVTLGGTLIAIHYTERRPKLRAFFIGVGYGLSMAIVLNWCEMNELDHSHVVVTDEYFSAYRAGLFPGDAVTVRFDQIWAVGAHTTSSRRGSRSSVGVRLQNGGGELNFDFGRVHVHAWSHINSIDRAYSARRSEVESKRKMDELMKRLDPDGTLERFRSQSPPSVE